MTFLDLFAGIGGFRRGLERSGHTCVGHVEIDKFANRSYMAMYGLAYCPYARDVTENSCKICRTEEGKRCEGNKCKGEWYAKDIKQITAPEIPGAEIWTFGFPCTNLSISGKLAGLAGVRSGLFFTVTGLLKSIMPEDKPRYVIAENVKHLLHHEKGGAFTTVLSELWEAGYDCEWQIVNSSGFGVPQHRERVYLVGHLRGAGTGKVLPVSGTNRTPAKRLVDGPQGSRVYWADGVSITLTANGGGVGGRTGLYAVSLNRKDGIKKGLDEAHTLTVSDGRGINRNQDQTAVMEQCRICTSFIDLNQGARLTEYARCVKAKQNAGIVNHKGETSGVFLCHGRPDCVKPVINPEKKTVRQNGRRIKAEGDPAFTITCQDRHGILLCCCTQWKAATGEDAVTSSAGSSGDGAICCRVRRLTPRECWRLQAFEDGLFDRARATGMSDSQLYKQAGNAVTVNIVYEIGLRLGRTDYGI